MNKNETRQRRARQTRIKIAELLAHRLTVIRSNCHISAQVYSPCGSKVVAAASTMEKDFRTLKGDKTEKAAKIGAAIADRAKKAGIAEVVFDRGGNKYAGRIQAVADAAREGGLKL